VEIKAERDTHNRKGFQRFEVPQNIYSSVFIKHYLVSLLLKVLVLSFFFYEIKAGHFFLTRGLFVVGNDTQTYYQPIENIMNGYSYGEPCRMPGLLPFYYTFRLFFTQIIAQNLIVIFQILFASFSSVLLALVSFKLSSNIAVYFSVLVLYSLNSFVGIWDIFGLAESFSVSFFIISAYSLLKFFKDQKLIFVFFSGLFLTWSLFLRPIMAVALLTTAVVIILNLALIRRKPGFILKTIIIFILPFLLFDGLWLYRNYKETNEIQPLAKQAGCYLTFTEQYYAMIKIPVALGMDITWYRNGEWFFRPSYNDASSPFTKTNFTSSFNGDSIISLRRLYFKSESETQNTVLKELVISKISQYLFEYKHEHPVHYYLVNPVKLFLKFVFPIRLDNLPFPPLNLMNWFQKMIKVCYLISLLIINILGLTYLFLLFLKPIQNIHKILLACIPFSILAALTYIMGFIEQRYFCPIYPFFLVYAIIQIINVMNYLKVKWLN
jgi:hypothetical protein